MDVRREIKRKKKKAFPMKSIPTENWIKALQKAEESGNAKEWFALHKEASKEGRTALERFLFTHPFPNLGSDEIIEQAMGSQVYENLYDMLAEAHDIQGADKDIITKLNAIYEKALTPKDKKHFADLATYLFPSLKQPFRQVLETDQKKSSPVLSTCNMGWKIHEKDFLGSGANGAVFRACRDGKGKPDCNFVAKIIPLVRKKRDLQNFNEEAYRLKEMNKLHFGQPFEKGYLCDLSSPLGLKNFSFPQLPKQVIQTQETAFNRIGESPSTALQDYGILISRLLPRSKPATKADLSEIEHAIRNEIKRLNAAGFLYLDANPDNILVYKEPRTNLWKATMIDWGAWVHRMHTRSKLRRAEEEAEQKEAMENLQKTIAEKYPISG